MSINKIHRSPDFNNMLQVLARQKPSRPTLFEFYMNPAVYEEAAGPAPDPADPVQRLAYDARAFAACGYDYVNFFPGDECQFPRHEIEAKGSMSMNVKPMIETWEDLEAYPWPDTRHADYSIFEKIAPLLPEGMKIMAAGPCGLLENVVFLVGYENLCYLVYDDPELLQAIFDRVGQCLLDYYERCAVYDTVGMLMINDDWGFNTQTMLSLKDLRRFVFPWHKKMVEAAHKNGKPAVLHSCGYMADVMEDIIEYMHYDGKHSYEDNITPVEEAYRRWGGRIAILGGLDVDFLVRRSEEEIIDRARKMLQLSREKGGYALGSGNSIPYYIPKEHYFAMTSALLEA